MPDRWTRFAGIDAIVVLPAGVKQDPSGRWISTELDAHDDRLGAPGGRWRIFAAGILARALPDATIITGGGLGYDSRHDAGVAQPMLAEILRDELLEIGVPGDRLLLEWTSNSTFQELQELEKIVEARGFDRLAIITNRWHLPRVRAMIDARFVRLNQCAALLLVAAEDILVEDDPATWGARVEETYRSGFIENRLRQERHGIEQIRLGTYNFR